MNSVFLFIQMNIWHKKHNRHHSCSGRKYIFLKKKLCCVICCILKDCPVFRITRCSSGWRICCQGYSWLEFDWTCRFVVFQHNFEQVIKLSWWWRCVKKSDITKIIIKPYLRGITEAEYMTVHPTFVRKTWVSGSCPHGESCVGVSTSLSWL